MDEHEAGRESYEFCWIAWGFFEKVGVRVHSKLHYSVPFDIKILFSIQTNLFFWVTLLLNTGLRPYLTCLSALVNVSSPKNMHHLRFITDALQYYSLFIPTFSNNGYSFH